MVKQLLMTAVACLLAMLTCFNANGQSRYLDEIFTEVTRTDTVVYGQNISILTGSPDTIPLICDIYQPVGDTASDRMVILLASTGNFLPRLFNGGPFGTIKDSANVEIATRLAKRGFVVANFYYRQGWDAANPDIVTQTRTLLQATYRGIQDARTCARWFRMTEDMMSNPYGINPDAIGIMGVGTGGYVAYACGYLNDFNGELNLIKFQDPGTGAPLVDTLAQSNLYGTTNTPLNIANHVGYSSDFQVVINVGGALGDSSWVNPGEAPSISFHCNEDPFAPYNIGNVIVPTTNNVVIDGAAGSFLVSKIQDRLGNNDVFKQGYSDAFTTAANARNNGWEGFMPFILPDTGGTYDCFGTPLPLIPQSSPWYWWDDAQFIADWDGGGFDVAFGVSGVAANCNQRANGPDASKAKANLYIDTLIGYMAPRLERIVSFVTKNESPIASEISLYPNPASDVITISNSDAGNPITEVTLLDPQGRVIYRSNVGQTNLVRINRQNWARGLYMAQIKTKNGTASKKLLLN
ncbi:MAG: T9SS type A sorting domain-containing protein [Bacteroidia bacterium]|nr:T9SS type A sorting domain-containing protein [Bacteroidia bacterium]